MEEHDKYAAIEDNRLVFSIKPFEIKTFKVYLK
jgi:hypothetical protein